MLEKTPMKTAAAVLFILLTLGGAAAATPSAEDLYAEGQAAYDRADYAAAIERWSESYRISGAPGLLFNLAQALRLSGDCPAALATYREFLAADADPASEQHRLAEDLARELDATCGEPSAVVPRVDPTDVVPNLNLAVALNDRNNRAPRPGRALRVAGLATAGTGVALLVAGLVVGRHARALGDEVTDACASSCDWETQEGKDAAGRRDAKIGYALDAVGVAAIAGGAVLYYVGVRDTVAVAPRPSEGGAVVSWSGSW